MQIILKYDCDDGFPTLMVVYYWGFSPNFLPFVFKSKEYCVDPNIHDKLKTLKNNFDLKNSDTYIQDQTNKFCSNLL